MWGGDIQGSSGHMVSVITQCMIELGFEEHSPNGDKTPLALQPVRTMYRVLCVGVLMMVVGMGV